MNSRKALFRHKWIALFILLFMMNSCQETPETNIIQIKNEDSGSFNRMSYNEQDIPETYNDNYSQYGVDIIFESSLALPESDSLPVYNVEKGYFSQNQVDIMIDGLFGDQKMYALNKVTKAELEEEYLKKVAELEKVKNNPDEYESPVEYYENEINILKERILNTPATDTLTPVSSKMIVSQEGIEFYGGRGDLGKDKMAELRIHNMPDNSYMTLINGHVYVDKSLYYPNILDDKPAHLNINKDEAVLLADKYVDNIGADHMELSGCSTGILDVEGGQFPESFDPQTPQAYLLYYTRCDNNSKCTFDIRSTTPSDSYLEFIMYERIVVAVDDSGVSYIRWQGPINVSGIYTQDNEIISFSDIINIAKKQLSYDNAVFENQIQPNENSQAQSISVENLGSIISKEIHIQRITLGYMKLSIANQLNNGLLVPVWDFFGYTKVNYEKGSKMDYVNNRSLLTINSINGNIIDRALGY